MKKNNSILVLGILSISFLIVLSIIQSSTAQRHDNPRHYSKPDYYNRYDDYNRYSYEQYNYDKSYGDNYDDYNRYSYEQYKKSLGDNYAVEIIMTMMNTMTLMTTITVKLMILLLDYRTKNLLISST